LKLSFHHVKIALEIENKEKRHKNLAPKEQTNYVFFNRGLVTKYKSNKGVFSYTFEYSKYLKFKKITQNATYLVHSIFS